jgi:hypothetical protein
MYDPSAYIREMSRQDSECASHHQRQVRYEARLEKTAAFRQRRAADTARWRERLHRGAAVYPVEVDGQLFDLMERFGELKDSKTYDRQAVATALGKLLRRALEALLREEAASATCSRTGSERPARPTLTEGQLR